VKSFYTINKLLGAQLQNREINTNLIEFYKVLSMIEIALMLRDLLIKNVIIKNNKRNTMPYQHKGCSQNRPLTKSGCWKSKDRRYRAEQTLNS
jgi:hypothetical protein